MPNSRAVASDAAVTQPPQGLRHKLAAVADAQNRQSQGKDLRVDLGGIRRIDAVRPAGEDNPLGRKRPDLCQRHCVRLDLTIYVTFTHTAGNQLVILAAEVQDQNLIHRKSIVLTEDKAVLIGLVNDGQGL